ncbi:MAG: lysophospholipase L1-like esterase [Flavipsychrobacter sp.]|jgi:lysophospholipase L1-like esterase|nr:lysophospholipase L1-like esterase [Flavipsychrobacter sp.]
MKKYSVGIILLLLFISAQKARKPMYTYLALGDSYTIGEQVPMHDNFPHQAVKLLKQRHIEVADPVIIATTGWTTDELAASIREHNIRETFSFVTLLIGVNNQYRGRSIDNYRDEFLALLNQAIAFADNKPEHVIVLSIPDWGVTPFAEGRDKQKVAKEIDDYNAACKEIALAHKCQYIEITESTRQNGQNPEYIVADKLHPSGKEYAIWAERLTAVVAKTLKK